jgi:hypothetical protein
LSSFEILRDRPLQAYTGFFRNNGRLWVFQHIPKTAGSSLTRELAGTLSPYRNIFIGPGAYAPGINPGQALMNEVDTFIEEHRQKVYRSASGHLRHPHLQRIVKAVPNTTLFTVLRDPAQRLVSDYRYAKTPRHPPHEAFARRYPTIEAYLDDPAHQNKMWHFVGPANAGVSPETLQTVFRRYGFFALVSELPLHFAFLAGLSTFPRAPQARLNVTEAQEDNAVDLSPALVSRIEKANGEDYALYAAVEAVLSRKRAEMRAFVEARRAYFLGETA